MHVAHVFYKTTSVLVFAWLVHLNVMKVMNSLNFIQKGIFVVTAEIPSFRRDLRSVNYTLKKHQLMLITGN
jgi:hypothetical protein